MFTVTEYVRLTTVVDYNGARGVPWFRTGLRHKFRLDGMKVGNFLPNMGTEVEIEIYYGSSGEMIIDVVIDDDARPFLVEGAKFTLHDSPFQITARGTVLKIERNVAEPLAAGALGDE